MIITGKYPNLRLRRTRQFDWSRRLVQENSLSTNDLILLESLISDGVKISKKYQNLFEFDQSNVPTDIQLLISNSEIANLERPHI